MNQSVTAYKAFNPDWTCRGYGYEVGKTYKHDGDIKLCESGFHACENPIDCLTYYPPTGKFAEVRLSGAIKSDNGNSKIVGGEITVIAELSLPDFLQKGVDYILSRVDFSNAKESNTGHQSAATNTGRQSAATNTGYRSAATNTGYRSAATNTGDQSAATNTGYRSAATNTGDQSAATNTGHQSAATNTGDQSAATNTGYQSAATNTGDQSAATNTGYQSAATNTGDQSAANVEGKHSVAAALGTKGKAKASEGSAIVLCERGVYGEILHIYSGIAGKDCEPDAWYTLKNGKLEKVI